MGGFSSFGGVVPLFGLGLGSRGVGDVAAGRASVGVLPVSGSAGVTVGPGPGGTVGGLPLASRPLPPLSLRWCEGSSGRVGFFASWSML